MARIERKLNWIADAALLAGYAAAVLILRQILVEMGERPAVAIFTAILVMAFAGYVCRRGYSRL